MVLTNALVGGGGSYLLHMIAPKTKKLYRARGLNLLFCVGSLVACERLYQHCYVGFTYSSTKIGREDNSSGYQPPNWLPVQIDCMQVSPYLN